MNAKQLGEQPAFPQTTMVESVAQPTQHPGITKRELFTAFALAGFCANPAEDYIQGSFDDLASWAEQQADAQLARLAKGGAQ